MIEIIHEDDELQAGYVNIAGKSFPGLGIRRKRSGSIHGIAFNAENKIDAAIKFLQQAKQELYSKKTPPKT